MWPASFPLARAYLDQLERNKGLDGGKIAAARSALSGAEMKSGADRRDALKSLAKTLKGDANGAADQSRMQKLSAAVSDLGNATR